MVKKVTAEQLKIMRCMLGLQRSDKPYRNSFGVNDNFTPLEELIKIGLAKKTSVPDGLAVYSLTHEGAEIAYGKSLSEKEFKKL